MRVERWATQVDGVDLSVAALRRDGGRPPVLFLHGFGSSKEDYADAAHRTAFAGRGLLAYDAPGCGETACGDLRAVSIPFLARVAEDAVRRAGFDRFHLVGHSMGGLTGLLLARRWPERVLSFVDIEGNLAPEDCFLSRQARTHPGRDPDDFLRGLADRARRAPSLSSALYAASLPHKVRAGAVRGIFESMVDLSDHGDLLATYLALPFPRMFMHGEQNASLSYLGRLVDAGVEVAAIPASGHWPMYANPVAMWARIAAFVDRSEAA